jgi:hypothetical protein
MKSRASFLAVTLLASAVVLAAGLLFLGPAVAGNVETNPDLQAQRQTIVDLRTLGTALCLYSWLKDQSRDETWEAAKIPEGGTLAIGATPKISHGELVRLLVPKYLEEIPAADGWGHAYEVYLDPESSFDATPVMLIRSPGSDGVFAGESYVVGSFAAEETGEDLVWADGQFIRWPQRPCE